MKTAQDIMMDRWMAVNRKKKAHEAPPGGMALRFPKGAI